MTLFFNSLGEKHLGYAAIFFCIGLGFLFVRRVGRGEVGPGYWAMSFFFGSLGFLFWSKVVPLLPWQYVLVGEVFHILGFFTLVFGAYRFVGNGYRTWNIFAVAAWIVVWTGSILTLGKYPNIAMFVLKMLRALLFLWAGIMLLRDAPKDDFTGRRLAGLSLIAWGVYIVLSSIVRIKGLANLWFGFLVGLQVLAAFGMSSMVIEKMRKRAEASEKRVERLEGLLPICSYCKKIRDKNNDWHTLELYIEDHSSAEFSHGICPDCMKKYHPDAK
jgi:hypothetical protein